MEFYVFDADDNEILITNDEEKAITFFSIRYEEGEGGSLVCYDGDEMSEYDFYSGKWM